MSENIRGPLLTDKEFFVALDERCEGLLPAISAAKEENYSEAVRLFADFIRKNLPVERFLSMEKEPPVLTESLLEKAEKILNNELTSCGISYKFEGEVDWFYNPTPEKYGEWPWQLSRHFDIHKLALLYRLTGDEKYVKGVVRLLDSWMKQAIRPEYTAPRGENTCWRTIECGIRMLSSWPDIIHYTIRSPILSDRFITDLFKSIYEQGTRLVNRLTHGNWLIMELCGLFNVSVLYPYFKTSDEWREISLSRFLAEMEGQIHPDGFQYELTTGYHDVVIVNIANVMKRSLTYGLGFSQKLLDVMKKMLYVYVHLMQSGGLTPDINDGSSDPASSFISKYISFFPDEPVFKFLLTDGKEGHAPDFTSSVLKNCGFVSFRDSWDINATTAFFDGGKLGKAHSHEDKLNLLVYAAGEPILTEAGKYAYDSSDMRRYSVSSFGHNVATINGHGQARRSNFEWTDDMLTSEEPLEFTQCDRFDRAVAVYDEDFGGEDKIKATHERSVTFVKKPLVGAPYFIVKDTVKSEKSAERSFLWHVNTDELLLAEGMAECDKLKMLTLGEGITLDIDCGKENPWRGWIANSARLGDYSPIPTLKVNVTGEDTVTVTLILPKKNGCAVKSASLTGNTVKVTYIGGECESFEL